MASLRVALRDGGTTVISAGRVDALRSSIRGDIILADQPGYDAARSVWNGMIDRRPALIARCVGPRDVVACVNWARDEGLVLAVRGGGHNIAGSGVCDDGLVIDLSSMRSVTVDPRRKVARVGPGATLAELDHETQAFGLAVPVGVNSTTGVAGLTLGGGFGWFSRKRGLTADNLRSALVVTANGKLLSVDARHESDLFWAIRGGGGNFGVAVEFEFDLFRLGPQVTAGLVVHPFREAGNVLRHYRSFAADAPDDVTAWALIRKAPPLPFLPTDVHGKEVIVLAAFSSAGPRKAKQLLAPLRAYGRPIADAIGKIPYTAWQQGFDPMLAPGARNYWKSHNLDEVSDDAIASLIEFGGRLPAPPTDILLAQLGGAVNRVAADATAYPHRSNEFLVNAHARWDDAADDVRCMAWAREFYERAGAVSNGGVYVNFMSGDESRVAGAFGANYARLAELKRRYDPTNLFRMNHNIAPARQGTSGAPVTELVQQAR
ncbi:MAG: FAD-binding oxidoreductase [Gemmatimonadota bacterium]